MAAQIAVALGMQRLGQFVLIRFLQFLLRVAFQQSQHTGRSVAVFMQRYTEQAPQSSPWTDRDMLNDQNGRHSESTPWPTPSSPPPPRRPVWAASWVTSAEV